PEHLSVFYTEGSNVRRGGTGAQPGFNLRREPPLLADPLPGDPQCVATPVGEREYLPLATEIPVALTAAPELSREICALMEGARGCSMPSCQPLPVPPSATLTCSADGTAFVYKVCPTPRGLCASSSCTYGCGSRAPGDPLPQGWPCP